MSNNSQYENNIYNHAEIEAKWQQIWSQNQTFKAANPGEEGATKPKFYVLDMFPYPSGAGLHVGHPLGYIASDIVSRFKRHQGFNVLHPMGYDSFGLPAEQYAIQTGQHPAKTTTENISRYRQQLDRIGFSFDWSREVRTSDPQYYKWTQWIFIQLFNSWYNPNSQKAEPIEELIEHFEKSGSEGLESDNVKSFTAKDWSNFSEFDKQETLMYFRLAYLSEANVNWCPALGTVLANDEVKDGFSERGGHPVERKKMKQWSMRITAYAERLLQGLEGLDWNENVKEIQRNWIGKSEGCSIQFTLKDRLTTIEVFTTRPDTLFGVCYMTLAPEHDLVNKITTAEQQKAVNDYIAYTRTRSERDRQTEVKKISGVFTGAYAIHPFTGAEIPVWIGDYVLAGYGTGAVMAVPAHDERDFAFAKHFGLPVPQVIESPEGFDISQAAWTEKSGKVINSDFLNGLEVKAAIKKMIERIEREGIGKGKTNFRLRDAVFGRQRYWGEPIPIYFKEGIPCAVAQKHLPLNLPEVDKFLPTESGEPPLARASHWNYHPDKGIVANGEGYPLEFTTMPGWAGSSWYFFRYMDAYNNNELASENALNYWKEVDFYVGGAEHATGHLLYARFWTHFLNDIGKAPVKEPFRKLLNQGMILGESAFHEGIDASIKIELVNKSGIKESSEHQVKIITNAEGDEIEELPSTEIHKFLPNEKIKLMVESESAKLLKVDKINLDIEIITYSAIHNIRIPIEYVNESNDQIQIEKIQESLRFNYLFDNPSGSYICSREIEKMSKSKWNVVNPDEICEQYGADTLRMYEMFLGPIEEAKPWNTKGIEGVYKFLRKTWRLFHNASGTFELSSDTPNEKELKTIHKTIKKITWDIDNLSFNTSISAFMICVNELQDLKCNKRSVLETLLVLLSPFSPHFAEELWQQCGHSGGISKVQWPKYEEKHLTESTVNYPISINGKMRVQINLPANIGKDEVEKAVLADETVQKWIEGKTLKKFIFVPGKIVNVVV